MSNSWSWHLNDPHPTIIFLGRAKSPIRCRKNYANLCMQAWKLERAECCSLVRSTVFKLIHHSRLIYFNLNFWCLGGKVVLKFFFLLSGFCEFDRSNKFTPIATARRKFITVSSVWSMLVLSIKTGNISSLVGLSKRLGNGCANGLKFI